MFLGTFNMHRFQNLTRVTLQIHIPAKLLHGRLVVVVIETRSVAALRVQGAEILRRLDAVEVMPVKGAIVVAVRLPHLRMGGVGAGLGLSEAGVVAVVVVAFGEAAVRVVAVRVLVRGVRGLFLGVAPSEVETVS